MIRVATIHAALLIFLGTACSLASAQNATWESSSSGNWSTSTNWSTGQAPGSTSSTTNTDTATFSGTSGSVTVTIDQPNQDIGSVLFTGTYTSSYTFSGQPLLLSSGGSITEAQLAQQTQNFYSALVLEPGSATSNGSYTLGTANNSLASLSFHGGISGGTTTGAITLNLGTTPFFTSTISGAISNGGAADGVAVTQNGGTWTLSGANTYTGPTTINSGTLDLTGSLSSTTSLTFNGGVLSYMPTSSSTQTVNGTTFASGASEIISNGGLHLGAISRNTGAMAYFPSAGGSSATSSSNTNGILGPWAVAGGSNQLYYATISGGVLTSYFGATAATAGFSNMTSAKTNYSYSASTGSLANDASGNTLSLSGTSIDTAGHTLTLNGLLGSSLNPNSITGTGALAIGSTGELDVISLGTTTISAAITGSGSLVYGGIGNYARLVLSGNNSYVGGTILNPGFTSLSGSGTLGATTNSLTLSGGDLDLGGTSQEVGALSGASGQIYDSVTASPSTLTFGNGDATGGNYAGSIADGFNSNAGGSVALNKVGAGIQTLSGVVSNSGGTTVSKGVLYIDGGVAGTSSGGGAGGITVQTNATLGGSGVYRPTQANVGITLASHANLVSGFTNGTPGSSPSTGGLTLDNTVAKSVILNATLAAANLTFSLRAGNVANPSFRDFASPNTNSSYMTVLGDTLGEIRLGGDNITINDDTGTNNLQLSLGTPYLLIQAGTNPGVSESSNDLYAGLITSGGVDGHGGYNNGWVLDLTLSGTAAQENPGAALYLYDGELEAVPEPGTWTLLPGGLALLALIRVRAKRRA
jgi:autotransporter-associated beta strand protein